MTPRTKKQKNSLRSYRRRQSRLFRPDSAEKFPLSRTKLEQFVKCRRCFYLDRRLGIGQPPGFPFNLNSAVDHLLKNEFDGYRERGVSHPLMHDAGIDAIPAPHEQLDEWRNNFKGVRVHHAATNLEIFGAIDDLWITTGDSTYAVVDYKATSKKDKVNIDADWQKSYKRQMEIYQWLLRGNGLTVSNTGYFVYCNGKRDRPGFDSRLEFDIDVIPYKGNDDWVEKSIREAHECLMQEEIPSTSANCDYCTYYSFLRNVERVEVDPSGVSSASTVSSMSQPETGVEEEPGLFGAARDQKDQWNDPQIHEDGQDRANGNMEPENPKVR